MKAYGGKWEAKRGFIRAGGDAAQFEARVTQDGNGVWWVNDADLPKKVAQRKGVCVRRFPPVDMSKHKTGDALIAHIAAFDKSRNLRPGSAYIIGGKEVRV